MDIELVSKPARDLLNQLLKIKDDNDSVSGQEYPELVNFDNPWLDELKELKFISIDHVPTAFLTNKGLTYPERRKAYMKEIMLTSFWLPILVSIIVSLLIASTAVQ